MAAPSRKRARSTWLAPMLSAGFGAGASALGYAPLAPYASGFGSFLGQKFKDITGYGAYSVRKNVLMGDVPSVGNSSRVEGGLTISHREYLGDVITSVDPGAFTSYSITINPGSSQAWEWLAQIACNYEQWVPEGILYCFKSTSSNALNSTNTALGTVIMATQYDPFAPPFKNKAEMMSYEYSSSGLPSEDIIHMIECDPMQNPLATLDVRSPFDSQGDPRFANLGVFTVATSGFQGSEVRIGELWVTYQITLLKPKLYASLGRFHDYFFISAKGLNRKDDGPLGHMVDSWIDPSTTMPISFQPGTTSRCTDDGFELGVLNSTGLYIHQETPDTKLKVYFPQYAYGVSYSITLYQLYASSRTSQAVNLSVHSGNAATVPQVLWWDHAPATTYNGVQNIIDLGIFQPGQTLCPFEDSLERPYIQFYPSGPTSSIDIIDVHFCIVQIPDGQRVFNQ